MGFNFVFDVMIPHVVCRRLGHSSADLCLRSAKAAASQGEDPPRSDNMRRDRWAQTRALAAQL